MKSKLKKLFLIGIALSVLISCSVVDLEEHEHGIEASIKSRKISFNEFKSYTKAFNVINDVNKKNVVASTALNRIIRDTIRNFSIDTQEGLYITYANLHSFTFPVYRDVDNGKLENLVLSSQSDGSYKVKLLIYTLTPQEKVDLTLGRLRRVQNPIVTIPIQNFDTNFTEAGSCEEVTTNIFTTCSGEGKHSFAAGNAFECAYWTQGGGTPPTFVTITRIVCVMSAGNGSGGGSGAGAGAGGPGGGGGDGNEYPANYPSNDTPPEDYNLGISIPVKPNPPLKTPCNQIKNITNNTSNLKANINSLNSNATLSLNYEKGFEYKDDANGISQPTPKNGIPGQTGIEIAIPFSGSLNFVLHSHYSAPGMMPCFTFEDLLVFSKIHKYKKDNNKPLDKITYMVVTQAGVFAMVIENESALENFLLSIDNTSLEKVAKKFYQKYPKNEDSDDEYVKSVIKSLDTFGVGLYKANDDLSNWNKLTVNANNNIVPNPCN